MLSCSLPTFFPSSVAIQIVLLGEASCGVEHTLHLTIAGDAGLRVQVLPVCPSAAPVPTPASPAWGSCSPSG